MHAIASRLGRAEQVAQLAQLGTAPMCEARPENDERHPGQHNRTAFAVPRMTARLVGDKDGVPSRWWRWPDTIGVCTGRVAGAWVVGVGGLTA